MAQSSYGTYLMHSTDGTTFTKLVDIIDYSDLEEAPETIDTTTLSDDTETNIGGIKRLGSGITFTINIDPTEFLALRTEADAKTPELFAIWFENGAYDASKFTASKFAVYFSGTFSVVQNGAGVDEALQGTITIYPQRNSDTNRVINYTRPSAI